MAVNSRLMKDVRAAAVFDALRDGQTYGHWVVGTRAIRTVEPGWPAPGTAIHYTVGYAPLRKDDKTTSLRYEPDTELELEAQAWPAGTARIVVSARESPDGTMVTIDEEPSRGLARRVHNPVLDLAIKVRNIETLRRLEQQARRKQT